MLKQTVSNKRSVSRRDYQRLRSDTKPPKVRCLQALLKHWGWSPQPLAPKPSTPSPLITPQEHCRRLVLEALKSSQHKEAEALYKWTLAKIGCEKRGVSFKRAVDEDLPLGGTALRGLVTTHDHISLRYVHGNLPAGSYAGSVYLCDFRDNRVQPQPVSSRTISKSRDVAYWGTLDRGDLCGYGVLDWVDKKSYVGEWRSCLNFRSGHLATERHCYVRDGISQLLFIYTTGTFDTPTIIPSRIPYQRDFQRAGEISGS